ncbi:Smr/MutS family protein [bacterium]|nr:Smr/MutS family protein [bacterium]
MPIENVLDLHTFDPRDVKELLEEYISEASKKGFRSIRIIHGKGRGVLRRITRSVCEKHLLVENWKTADEGLGGWGATIIYLKVLS